MGNIIEGSAAVWSLEETIRFLRSVAKQEFCGQLVGLQADPAHAAMFELSTFSMLAEIGRSKTLNSIPSKCKVYGLATVEEHKEVYFQITTNHFGHGVECVNDKSVLLLDIVYPRSTGWSEFQSLLKDIESARKRMKSILNLRG